MSDIALFRDYYKIVKPKEEEVTKWKDSLVASPVNSYSSASAATKGLEVTFEATHAALFNDNLRFYLPSRMMDGVSTFINRKKPAKILKHHDSQSDPVGIIVGAEYIPTIPEGLENDKNIQIMMDSSNSITKQVAAAKRFLRSGIPFSDGWRGLGYIQLKGVLLDEKAIQQVSDGLFDAVSTSFRSPGHAYCSECQQNWAADGFCEHEPGKKYGDDDDDKVICAVVPGVHNYDECSLVVFDGDPLTQISIGHQDSVKEFSVNTKDWQNNSVEDSNSFAFSFRDYKEENTMADKATEVILSDAEQEVMAAVKKLRPELDEMQATDIVKKLVAMKTEDGLYPHQEEANLNAETAFVYALEEIETADEKIDADAICDEMQAELKAMLEEELLPQEEYEAADAKLSTAQRKKLSESTFCGPDRSFPVPDCAHVTAARRLIGRYKGPGSKAKILSCVNRKAKALGCDSKKDCKLPEVNEQNDKFEIPSCDMIDTLEDKEAKELFNMMEAEMISRNLKLERPCAKCASHEDEANRSNKKLEDAEVKISGLENTLVVLRDELRNQINDYMSLVDQNVEQGVRLVAAQKDHLALAGTVSGQFESLEKAMDSLKESDIKEQQTLILKDFNLENIMNKINDGMANEPTEGVEDPTVNKDIDNNQLPDGLSRTAIEAIENMRDFIKKGDHVQAKRLYGSMVTLKVIDEKLVPFENLSAKNNAVDAE